MQQNLRIVQNAPLYLQIADTLRRSIEEGEYKTGDCLPTETRLTEMWKVSRLTVRNAIKLLTDEGLIYRISGKGTFVGNSGQEISTVVRKQAKARRVSDIIGLLIPCVTISLYADIVRAVEDIADEHGYNLVIGNYDVDPGKEQHYLQKFMQQGIKGIISAPSYNSDPSHYREVLDAGIPLVMQDIQLPGLDTDLVTMDNIKSGMEATGYLLNRGLKRIGFICGGLETSSSQERLLGYKLALMQSGTALDSGMVRGGGFTADFGSAAARELIAGGADGIVAANENLTVGIARVAQEAGVKVASIDKPHLPASLTCVKALVMQPSYDIGRTAANILFQRMREASHGGERLPHQRVCLPPKMLVLSSGEYMEDTVLAGNNR